MKEKIENVLASLLPILLSLLERTQLDAEWVWSNLQNGVEIDDIIDEVGARSEDLVTLWLIDVIFLCYWFTRTFQQQAEDQLPSMLFPQLVEQVASGSTVSEEEVPGILDRMFRSVLEVALALARERLPTIADIACMDASNPILGWSIEAAVAAVDKEDEIEPENNRLELIAYVSNRLALVIGALATSGEGSIASVYMRAFHGNEAEDPNLLSELQKAQGLIKTYEEVLRLGQ